MIIRIIIFLVVLAVTSCGKKTENNILNNLGRILPDSDSILIVNLNVDSSNVLLSKNKSRVVIPSKCFVDKDGNEISGVIRFEFKEVLSKLGFIKNEISTITTDGRILESAGMYYFAAYQNGKELFLKKDKTITISTYGIEKISNVNIFKGTRKSELGSQLIWKDNGKVLDTFSYSDPNFFYKNDTLYWNKLCWFCDTSIYFDDNLKNTDYYTLEFLQRIESWCNPYIVNLYFQNTKRGLKYADSLVLDFLIKNRDNLSKRIPKYQIGERSLYFEGKDSIPKTNYEKLTKLDKSKIDFKAVEQIYLKLHQKLNLSKTYFNKDELPGYYSLNRDLLSYALGNKSVVEKINNMILNQSLYNYNIKINELGWHNIDKFLTDLSEVKWDITVKGKKENLYGLALFRESNTVVSLDLMDKEFKSKGQLVGFSKIPVNDIARIVIISIEDNNNILFDYFDFDSNDKIVKREIELKKNGKEDLRKVLEFESRGKPRFRP